MEGLGLEQIEDGVSIFLIVKEYGCEPIQA